jgi:uncharacterized peroxidase-related enzyme
MSYIETIADADASPDLADLYRRVAGPQGQVDHVMRVHSLNPESMRTHFELYKSAVHGRSPLSRLERELVAVVVSRLNGCEYCITHHMRHLKKLLGEERGHVADAIRAGRVTQTTDRENALIQYATKLTMNPHGMDHLDVQHLRDVELDDRAILDLVHLIGFFNYVNRIVKGLGVQVEG